MKNKELTVLSTDQLKEKMKELRIELIKQNAQVSTGTNPKSPGQIKQIKKNIARILTVINNRGEVTKHE